MPDAEVSSTSQVVIETKIRKHSVNMDQIHGHLKHLDHSKDRYGQQYLLILTPDDWAEDELRNIDGRIVCRSFRGLQEAIQNLLDDGAEVISEREEFLLRELQHMLTGEGLLGSDRDTVVVAARNAWPEYQAIHAYVCQPQRTFQPVSHIAFYTEGKIKPVIPHIVKKHDAVSFQRGVHGGRLSEIVEKALDLSSREEGSSYQVFELSAPDDPATTRLEAGIVNDATDKSGKPTAFTQGQRYVRLADLKKAKKTSQL